MFCMQPSEEYQIAMTNLAAKVPGRILQIVETPNLIRCHSSLDCSTDGMTVAVADEDCGLGAL